VSQAEEPQCPDRHQGRWPPGQDWRRRSGAPESLIQARPPHRRVGRSNRLSPGRWTPMACWTRPRERALRPVPRGLTTFGSPLRAARQGPLSRGMPQTLGRRRHGPPRPQKVEATRRPVPVAPQSLPNSQSSAPTKPHGWPKPGPASPRPKPGPVAARCVSTSWRPFVVGLIGSRPSSRRCAHDRHG
jgi:translation initiation factor IF-2